MLYVIDSKRQVHSYATHLSEGNRRMGRKLVFATNRPDNTAWPVGSTIPETEIWDKHDIARCANIDAETKRALGVY